MSLMYCIQYFLYAVEKNSLFCYVFPFQAELQLNFQKRRGHGVLSVLQPKFSGVLGEALDVAAKWSGDVVSTFLMSISDSLVSGSDIYMEQHLMNIYCNSKLSEDICLALIYYSKFSFQISWLHLKEEGTFKTQ